MNYYETVNIKYYKALKKSVISEGLQYEIGEIYSVDGELILDKNGIHFYDILNACYNQEISANERLNIKAKNNYVVYEVEPLGKIIHSDIENKLVTDKILILRQLTDEEIEKEKYVIQDGVKMIGYNTFNNCNDLEIINIPASVENIEKWSFCYCENLQKFNFCKDKSQIIISAIALKDCPKRAYFDLYFK